ncbi:ADP-ribose diphosphatase [Marinobacteraceae bacterium S3BR75-40.1]
MDYPAMDHRDFEIVERDVAFDGFFKIHRLSLKHRRFDGDWTPELRRELFVRGNATCVLPYDADRDQVVLCEQFRIGALEREGSPWLLELVAGMNEQGEDTEDVARREAMEEAGLELGDLMPITSYLSSAGGSSERITLYCGQVDASTASGVHGLDEEHEDIKVHVLTLDEALAAVQDGTIDNAAAIIALQWLALNRKDVRNRLRSAG